MIDLDRLLKLRLVVARHGEMGRAAWWNTRDMLGHHGAIALQRGLPRTHRFAQARIVFAVARWRCAELFDPPGCVTLWKLPIDIEEAFEEHWRRWLSSPDRWDPLFDRLEASQEGALLTELADSNLISPSQIESVRALRRSAFEYHHTSFSYLVNETGEERFVGVPEQGGRDLISSDPLPPGTVYAASVSGEGTVGLYRLEVTLSVGTGKLKPAGGIAGAMKESIARAFSHLLANKTAFGVEREVDTSDFHVEAIDLLGNRVGAELGVAFFVAAYSVLRRAQAQPALLVLGDMSIQGNIKPVRSLVEPLQVAMDNGAKRALIPIENKRNFLDVSGDVLENIDPIFYGDLQTAGFKALGLN